MRQASGRQGPGRVAGLCMTGSREGPTALDLIASEPPAPRASPAFTVPTTPPRPRHFTQSREQLPQQAEGREAAGEPGTGRAFGLKLQVWGLGGRITPLPAGLVS